MFRNSLKQVNPLSLNANLSVYIRNILAIVAQFKLDIH
jgi:hypothetical protein